MLQTTLSSEGGTALVLVVENVGAQSARFCRYQTPFEGFRAPFLVVTDASGAEVDYAGVMVKRRPPGDEDYVVVEAGERLEASFDLSEGYPVGSGSYTVSFSGGLVSGLPDSAPVSVDVP